MVLSPDRSAPTVVIAVYYDVGFRSEPEGRSGFAHLFEHLMFQGSGNLDKLEHPRLVQSNGGVFNGSTSSDYTNYFEQLPSGALELGLFLEADRMRGLRLNQENLDNQISVVKEEIRVNVLNQPYGGFPWILLPPVLFKSFNNAHNGYGSFTDLESASVEDAEEFFDRYYSPANAVLAVVGDIDVPRALAMIEHHFGDIEARSIPAPPLLAEPPPGSEQRAVHVDPMAPMPALAFGYRVPDPHEDLGAYLATWLAGQVLTDGQSSRLHRRLVKDDRLVTDVSAWLGTFGQFWSTRDPAMFQLMTYYPDITSTEPIISAIDEELDRMAGDLQEPELDRIVTAAVSEYYARADSFMSRALNMAVLEQQWSDPGMANRLPSLLSSIDAGAVRLEAARTLGSRGRAVLELRPGSK
ncbi:MAG: M16 family metallopeptidase [Acidimicrobiales bacterium]